MHGSCSLTRSRARATSEATPRRRRIPPPAQPPARVDPPVPDLAVDDAPTTPAPSFPSASEFETEDPHGWHDLATGLVLVEVAFPTADERDYDGVELHYVAGMLGP